MKRSRQMDGPRLWTKVGVSLLVLCGARVLGAQIIAEALFVFPSETESLEYDNLAALRSVQAYSALRQQFAGIVLQQAKLAITRFSIPEDQVDEVVLGSTSTGSYGLFGGTFNGSAAVKTALRKGIPRLVVNGDEIFCPGAGICLFFLENSIAAFGTSEQLKTMLEVRQGIVVGLHSNRDLANLISATDPRAPVRGAAFGKQLNAVIANAFKNTAGKNIDWARYSAFISDFGYSVDLDSKAHVKAIMKCKTSAEAALLRQMLDGLAALQFLAAQAGKDQANMPFQNMQVSSSDHIVELKMDSPIPSS